MAWSPQNSQLWHEMMADLLILDPTLTNLQIAEQLGLHEQTVAIVKRTDMFDAIVARRRLAITGKVEQTYLNKLQGKVQDLAEVSVDTLTEQVKAEQKKHLDSPSRGTLESCEVALKALGFIGKSSAPAYQQPGMVINAGAVIIGSDVLASARSKMRAVHAQSIGGDDGEQVANTALLSAPAKLP